MDKFVDRFVAIGLKRPTSEKMEALINKWIKASGPEWTVRRLKSLKAELLGEISGNPEKHRAQWVKRSKDGTPYGTLGEIFRIGKSGAKGAAIAINSLMVYSYFTSEHLTDLQERKFFGSMESEDMTGLSERDAQIFPDLPVKVVRIEEGEPWTNQRLTNSCFQPGPDGKSYPETDTFMSWAFFLNSTPCMSLMRSYSSVFNEVMPVHLALNMYSEGTVAMQYRNYPISSTVGKISFIQEPGFKLRAICNPNRIIQAVLEPLKKALGNTIRQLDQDCTFDQQKGINLVKEWISEGKTVHSVDLSDATNLFPLSYTYGVLLNLHKTIKDLGEAERYMSLVAIFKLVSGSPWFAKRDHGCTLHQFKRGQPLGLGPSFFAFGLSHHSVMHEAIRESGASHDCYVILGDDIVINDSRAYECYKTRILALGCKISDDKSFSSNRMAEFAGKIITKDLVIPQLKWRDITDRNVVDVCRLLGPSVVTLLNSRQKKLISLLATVPDFLGGLGWNQNGVPLSERLKYPLNDFILNRSIDKYLPFIRLDRNLKSLVSDERFRLLTPNYIHVDSSVSMIPLRYTLPQWGTQAFWNRFFRAENSYLPMESKLPISEQLQKTDKGFGHLFKLDENEKTRTVDSWKELYSPYYGDDNDPKGNPWFDLVRYFEKNLRSLIPTYNSEV